MGGEEKGDDEESSKSGRNEGTKVKERGRRCLRGVYWRERKRSKMVVMMMKEREK